MRATAAASWSSGASTRLKQFRAVATRFEKRAVNYRAMVVIASLLIWLEG